MRIAARLAVEKVRTRFNYAFGFCGYEYALTDGQDGQVILTIQQDSPTCRCPACGSRESKSRAEFGRRFRVIPVNSPKKLDA